MPTRTPKKQSQHDAKVRQIARKLRREGWNVEADIPGFNQPDPIGRMVAFRMSGQKRLVPNELSKWRHPRQWRPIRISTQLSVAALVKNVDLGLKWK
ncbi:MAG: hypothetical protein IIA89_12935 [Chloroflexi bacterium]|nr:hypothetical protein [Chloroflexota bacterium]